MDSLGDRMKGYEGVFRQYLIRRTPVIVRVDGRAFHTYTRNCKRPWDQGIQDRMTTTAQALMADMQGARLAYIQSDEISILLVDYNKLDSEPWFSGNVQKIVSCAAATATLSFGACFDARAFNLPREEVVNYFLWRQRDAERNSILGLAQTLFSHKQIQGMNVSQLQNLMFSEKGVNWGECRTRDKRGWCVLASGEPDFEIPRFNEDRGYIQALVDRVEEG